MAYLRINLFLLIIYLDYSRHLKRGNDITIKDNKVGAGVTNQWLGGSDGTKLVIQDMGYLTERVTPPTVTLYISHK